MVHIDYINGLSVMKIEVQSYKNRNMKAQEYLDLYYPKEERKKVNRLNIERQGLTEVLDLSDFINLTELNCEENELSALNLADNSQLEGLCCFSNQLEELNLPKLFNLVELKCYDNCLTNINFLNQLINPNNLKVLNLSDDKIQPTDIEVFSEFVNLKELRIGNST